MNKVTINGTQVAEGGERKTTRLDTLTGEEFKQLIEQVKQSGKIDTLPELFAFLDDVPEGMTLADYIREHGGQPDPEVLDQAIDENLEKKAAESSDIDEIFGDEEPEDNVNVNDNVNDN